MIWCKSPTSGIWWVLSSIQSSHAKRHRENPIASLDDNDKMATISGCHEAEYFCNCNCFFIRKSSTVESSIRQLKPTQLKESLVMFVSTPAFWIVEIPINLEHHLSSLTLLYSSSWIRISKVSTFLAGSANFSQTSSFMILIACSLWQINDPDLL